MQSKAFSMEDLFAFLNAGVSAFHSTAAAAAILEAEGYRNCPPTSARTARRSLPGTTSRCSSRA